MFDTKFLYMDEKYAEQSGPPRTRITSLTGVLIPATVQPVFRNRYYQLVTNTIADPPNAISEMPLIHAASMFPQFGKDDSKRFEFVRAGNRTRYLVGGATSITDDEKDQDGRNQECKKQRYSRKVEVERVDFPREGGGAFRY